MGYKAGSVIGDYVVIGAIGSGGMGTVYKVQHVITQRIEAMKLLASGRTDPDQEQRFLREMQLQARLHHPNIAAVYNAFRFYEEFFLVMEFIDGESLDSILSRGRLALPTGLHYARQALFALGYAHAHGVVHRDIAPSNMLITPEGTVKLTDFGLAKTATDVRLTHSGAPLGSPWYMSPEQVRGTAVLDARSDIYSLGAVLYEIVTGTRPFDLASTFDVMRAHVEMAPMPPGERAPGLPPKLSEIILMALAKDPASRFQSAEQFYAALEPMLSATPHPLAGARPAPAPAQQPRVSQRPRVSKAPAFPRLRVAQAALGSAACLGTMFAGYSAYSFLRATSTTPAPQIEPAKTAIPVAPVIPAAEPAPLPAIVEVAPPVAETPVEPAPRPRRTRALIARTATPSPVAAQPLREIPPAPERIAPPVLETPALNSTPRTAVALIAPPPAAEPLVRPQPDPEPQVITNSPVVSADELSKDKREGNRFVRVLHKIKLFHKNPSNTQDSSSQ